MEIWLLEIVGRQTLILYRRMPQQLTEQEEAARLEREEVRIIIYFLHTLL